MRAIINHHKKVLQKTPLYIIFLLLASYQMLAQEKEISSVSYTIEDGLSQSDVTYIFQDSRGLIWIGTQSGLNRFDGRTFTPYTKDPTNPLQTISSGYVYSIDEDSFGNLWIGTQNGLDKFDPSTEIFHHYLDTKKDKQILGNNNVYGVLVDENNTVWFKTNYTLSKLIPEEDRIVHFSYKSKNNIPSNVDSDVSIPLIKTKDGIWMGSFIGLQFFSFKTEKIQTYKAIPNDDSTIPHEYVTALTLDEMGNLFVGTHSGIAYFDTKLRKVVPLLTRQLNYALGRSGSKDITGILLDNKDNSKILTVTTFEGGIVIFDLKQKNYKLYKSKDSKEDGVSDNDIQFIFKDKTDNLWLSINGKGIEKHAPYKSKFETYRKGGFSNLNLSENIIVSLYATENEIWAGTWTKGVNIINRKTLEVQQIYEGDSLAGNQVFAIAGCKDNIWIGTDYGITVYREQDHKFLSFEEAYGVSLPKKLKESIITSIKQGYGNTVAISSSTDLYFFDTEEKTFSKIKNIGNFINDIYIDYQNLYVATMNGFFILDKKRNVQKRFTSSYRPKRDKQNHYLNPSCNEIYDIEKDKSGYFWLATEAGINKYNPAQGTFEYFSKENSNLPDNTIYDLILYNNRQLWFSTNKGLGVLDIKTNRVHSYKLSDGLQGLEFNKGASAKSPTGELLFGGLKGFNMFHPDSIRKNTNKPITLLLSYTVIDKEGRTKKVSLLNKDKIELSYNDNSLRIDFASLEYTNPLENSFQYKLDGKNNYWVDLGTQNYVSFPNIEAGEYKLKIKSSNNDFVYGDEVCINIYVNPPLYANKYAYLLYTILVLIVIYMIWKRVKWKQKISADEIRKKALINEELEKQRQRLTAQNKNIQDSISYAKYIQQALLPSQYLIKKLFPESFVLYLNKDIVSGDFYWVTQRGHKTFIAAVDCTGHGVPGAFMSIVGFNLLKSIVIERGVEDPAEILNQLNYETIDTFKSSGTNRQIQDGMDMSLCVIEHNKNTLVFSGAVNPLCLIRNNEVSLFKGNRFSIGSFKENDSQKFDSHTIPFLPGDNFYMYSDGYIDQFGGSKGKKFKHQRFLHLLLSISHLSMTHQKNELKDNFNRWKGSEEQIDDVLVIGFKL